MRILWISDTPTTPSGFGLVTRQVCKGLAQRGHHIEILGWQTHGAPCYWEGILVHPIRKDQFGSDVLSGYLLRIHPDFVITLGDIWWMSNLTEPDIQRYFDFSSARWIHYYPVDGADPEGKLPLGWIKLLKFVDIPVTMSQFGYTVSKACGINSTYIPHGCDINLFKPPKDKEKAKARYSYEGKFVILSDARNQPRKLLVRTLDIAKMFILDKPDVLLHLHADPNDAAANSDLYRYDISEDIATLGLKEQVRFTKNFRMIASGGIQNEELAAIYAAADVHLLCSWGEGFGLPNLQAASSGVVPIAVAYSASKELTENHGFAVATESVVTDEFGLVRHFISRESAVQALDSLYYDRKLLARRSKMARTFAEAYSWKLIIDQWEQLLKTAPKRQRPTRSTTINWTSGEEKKSHRDLTSPVTEAMSTALASLPEGVKLSIQMTERKQGEVLSEIHNEAFSKGDELSIPVRLPPFFKGAPHSSIGYALVSPKELPNAAILKHIFPGLSFAVPRPGGDPNSDERPSIEQLLPVLPHCCIVIDFSSSCTADIDIACAALGIPYAGQSGIWPKIDLPPLMQLRKLLTDQGFSEWRRWIAFERAVSAFGLPYMQALRRIALDGQPKTAVSKKANIPAAEIFLVRAKDKDSTKSLGGIGEYVASKGGYILMSTAGGLLFVALPKGGKEILEACPLVGFVGSVHLDGDTKVARALKQRFALNIAKQLATKLEK